MSFNLTDAQAEAGLLSFMSARCDVSSQHKLPGVEEILATVSAEMIGVERTRKLINAMLKDGRLIAYGPYISDHEIDVL